jgi:GNAT superfamily N-acetyltransferase
MGNSATAEIAFRALQPSDLEAGLRLCRLAGWNQTRRDWELFLKLNPDNSFVALKGERVVGTVTAVGYENRFSWIGMVLVDPEERGQGIGTRLVSVVVDALKDIPSIRLDATPAGCEVYRKLDFVEEYRLSRMEIVARAGDIIHTPARPMTREDLSEIALLDGQVFGAARREILEWMFEGAPEYARVSEREGRIIGYAFGRHGFDYEHLGPVVAHDQQTARELVAACLHRWAGRKFILDASHYEPEWRLWLEAIGFRELRPFIRMFYRGNPYPGLPPKYFAILGPEFG